MIRVQAVLASTGIQAAASFDDEWMFTACPRCGVAQALADCPIRPKRGNTHYRCKNSCQDLVIVSPAVDDDAQAWPGRGYRFGEHLVRNAVDVVIVVGPTRIRLNASAAALLPESSRPTPPPRRQRPMTRHPRG
jgi:hypothetical protein